MSHRSRTRADSGSATVELVVLAPVLVILTLFVVFLGRTGGAAQQVRHAADVGARAASQASLPTMRETAAAAVARDLADNGVNCSTSAVTTVVASTANHASSVTVTVSCSVNGAGLSLLGANSRTVTAHSTEVIDRYRGS